MAEDMRHTKYEKSRIVGSRALQISMGAPFLIKLAEKKLEEINFNPVEIAKLEYAEGVVPITIKRPLPHEQ
jgi:DNA-directed RNA polymerase subunit K/omega